MILTYNQDSFDAYRRSIDPMLAKMEIKKVAKVGAPPAAPPPPPVVKLQVPPAPKKMALAQIAGTWKEDDTVLTDYEKAKIRTQADYDAIAAPAKFTVGAKGVVTLETIAKEGAAPQVSSGKADLSKDGVLTLKTKGVTPQIYVVRGLYIDPSLVVLKMNGPWFGDVPMDVKSDPNKGPSLDHYWVRSPGDPAMPPAK
jgi:hypothetical protein